MTLDDLYRLLRSGHVQAQGVVDTMTQPIVVLDRSMCVTTANNAFLKEFKVERDEILGEVFFDLGNGQWNIPELRELFQAVIPKAVAVAGYEVKHDFPTIGQRTFLVDARRLVHPDDNSTSLLVLFDDVTERQRHDAERDFVISETRHRMKNLFAIVRSLAMRTDVEGLTGAEYRDAFLGRLEATLRAQEIAAASEATDLKVVIRQSVGDVGQERLRFQGPEHQVPSETIVPITMIFHELATNSIKYGALSAPEGKLKVIWSLENGSGERRRLRLEWREEDGPQVKAPERKGLWEPVDGGYFQTSRRQLGTPVPVRRFGRDTGHSRVRLMVDIPELKNAPKLVLVVEDEFFLALDLDQALTDAGFQVQGPAATVDRALALISMTKPVNGGVKTGHGAEQKSATVGPA